MIDSVIQWHARRRLRQLHELATDPRAAQQRVFSYLVKRCQQTSFGRQHGLGSVETYADFCKAVPLRDYAGLAPWWDRARNGEPDVTWPGRIRYWAISSGTTDGEMYLPVSEATIRAGRQGAFDAIAPALAQDDPRLFAGRMLFLGGSTSLRKQGDIWIGDNTGIHTLHIPRIMRRWHSPGARIAGLSNWEEKIRRAAQVSSRHDIRMLSGVPSWICLFAQEVLAQTGCGSLLEVWPNLKLFVHGGMAFAPYRKHLLDLVGGKIRCVDTYSASEGGMLAVQDQISGPGMLPLCDLGVHFEFVPARELGHDNPTRLRLHEVETGTDYAVVLNTDSGIYGYLVGDLVRFESTRPLRLLFAGRIKHTLNAFGEHICGGELDRAIAAACDATGAEVGEYAVATTFPDAHRPVGGHLWYVEFRAAPANLGAFANALDATIAAGNEDYACHRIGSFGMVAPTIQAVPPGTFYAWMRARGRFGGQNKVPRVLTPGQEAELQRELPQRVRAS